MVTHPVTGRKAVWAAPANVQSVEGMGPAESQDFIHSAVPTFTHLETLEYSLGCCKKLTDEELLKCLDLYSHEVLSRNELF